MSLDFVIALLRKEVGLNPESIGESAVEHAMRRRMSATRCVTEQEYEQRLSHSTEELQELIEEISVPETWFFREESAFECLRTHVHSSGKLRPVTVACMPCATGEEAYTIAMVLLDMGIAAERFRVHALDISYRALLRAQQAVYGEYSFRSADKAFRARYFQAGAEGYQVIQTVRNQVSFYHGNSLALPNPFDSAVYDVVFCRNMLIYLDDEARKSVIEAIKKMLAPDGILLVGHSEASIALQMGFVRDSDGALHFGQAQTAGLGAATHPVRARRAVHVAPPALEKTKSPMPFASVAKAVLKKPEVQAEADDLGKIRGLADGGKLDEARRCCEDILLDGKRSAELYSLLGLVLNAQGEVAAARECYRKAMYLNPHHEEARQQLAVLDQRHQPERRSPDSVHGSERRELNHG